MSYKFKCGNKEIEVPKNTEFTSHAHSWSAITGKPSSFTPSAHNQDWGTITGKPSSFNPTNHSHAYATWLGAQYASGGEWLGFYNAYGGSRKGWIGHDGSTDFAITNEAGGRIRLNGNVMCPNTVYFQNDQQIYGGYYSSSYNLYISAPSGYLALYSRGNALYYDGKYIDANWSGGKFNPGRSGVALGGNTTGERWYRLYAANASNTSSDKRLKTNFSKFDERYIKLFEKLEPIIYNFISNENGNKEAGMIAQDVEKAMEECGITQQEFGTCEIDGEGMYSLIYQDIYMLSIYYIQTKTKEFTDEINSLRNEIQELKNLILK